MHKKFQNVLVLSGGNSPEREISLRSGKNVLNALLRKGYAAVEVDPSREAIPKNVDAAYIALHGEGGEDGVIQGVLTHMGIPYTGPKILSSAIAMDKIFTKHVLQSAKLPTPKFEIITSPHTKIPFPVVLKPASAGSSIGVYIIKDQTSLHAIFDQVHTQFSTIFVEEYIHGKEITVGIIENEGNLQVLPILQLVPHNEFYDFEAKYTKGLTDFILPADLSPTMTKNVNDLAMKTFNSLNCRSVSRVDMIITPEENIHILEVNTSPGMTDTSDLPAQALSAGIQYDDLVQIIMESASL